MKKRLIYKAAILLLISALMLPFCAPRAAAKTNPSGQTVGTVLMYVTNSSNEKILISQLDTVKMKNDLEEGIIRNTVYNYSLLDRYVTTVHQEAQGLTVDELVNYAKEASTVGEIRKLNLTFAGNDRIRFWEIDDMNGDDDERDTYTWNELYGVQRYNYPLLYEYWNYRTQDYYDPAGVMSRDEVVDYIFDNAERTELILSVSAFSQRYMVTEEKYDSGDYNMEDYWTRSGMLDGSRTLRVMSGMTEEDLSLGRATASNSRYWIWNLLLTMENAPELASKGNVSAPTAEMKEDGEYYYISFECETPGAVIYYNHNYRDAGYMPTKRYSEAVKIPKASFPDGTVTITAHAVKDGCTDEGVVTLKLKSSGYTEEYNNPYSDVKEKAWYAEYIRYVTERGFFDALGEAEFKPEAPMTRAMLASALYRMAGRPQTQGISETPFTDVEATAEYAAAVAWCYTHGIVNGTAENLFSPNDSITREQIVAMFYRYAKKAAGAEMSVRNDLSAFQDREKLSGYARESMQWAVAAGLISGVTEDTIVPKGTATRAQTAALVQRLAEYTSK